MSAPAIEVRGLVKAFDGRRVVDDITFTAPPGTLTGFIGANGAGKTTTIRTLLGLIAPTDGTATIGGERYRYLKEPRRQVGAVLGQPGAHPGHRGLAHLEILARSAGLPASRAVEVLELVELSEHGQRRVGKYSLGMQQRLSLAAALLGDPPVLILDEPTQGLDPAGIRWLRDLMRRFADEGRTLLVSSHHLAELEAVADRVVMIDRGRIVASAPIEELLVARDAVLRVRSGDDSRLAELLIGAGAVVTPADGAQPMSVVHLAADEVGAIAAANAIAITLLEEVRPELESLFFGLTAHPDGREAADVADVRR